MDPFSELSEIKKIVENQKFYHKASIHFPPKLDVKYFVFIVLFTSWLKYKHIYSVCSTFCFKLLYKGNWYIFTYKGLQYIPGLEDTE